MQRREEKSRKTKRRTTILAALLVFVMMLTSTFAWQSFNQRAFNPTFGTRINHGGRLHHDYHWNRDDPTEARNKNIYAENFSAGDLFVRVQIREFFTLDGEPIIPGTRIDNPKGWSIYQAERDDVTARRANTDADVIGEAGVNWTFGAAGTGFKVFMPTFNHATRSATSISDVPAPFNNLNAYQMTNATGMAVDGIADFNIDEVTSVVDILNEGFQTGLGDGTRDYWEYGEPSSKMPVLYVDEDEVLRMTAPVTHDARLTIVPTHDVMTLDQWERADRPTGEFWVLDTENEGGWFYWASPLPPGHATSLLLEAMTMSEQHEEWEYVTMVTGDFVSVSEIDTLNLSDEARALWSASLPEPELPEDDSLTTEPVWQVVESHVPEVQTLSTGSSLRSEPAPPAWLSAGVPPKHATFAPFDIVSSWRNILRFRHRH